MSQQTTYTTYHGKGYSGQIADCSPLVIDTKLNEESTSGVMQFGLGVAYGTNDDQVLLPTSGDTTVGFTVYTKNYELVLSNGEN